MQHLKFDEQGLIPAIVQDDQTREVLMIAYMNAESLTRTLQTGETWFWSRSRQSLWHKGETSGNIQQVVDLRVDCDGDALLVLVRPKGPACHTGEQTCFYRSTSGEESGSLVEVKESRQDLTLVNVAALDLGILLEDLYQLIRERAEQRPENSYTTYLFEKGLDKILKKVGEECAETIIAAKNVRGVEGRQQLSAEISDLLYHLLVLMVDRDLRLADIVSELHARTGRPAERKYHRLTQERGTQ
ncbi:MAG: bifunctional phosphoribosyl-AMP cyclohydrolase/phosphoribosyl-ATP diphosphatase HisIE [Blastocatellia bacterium]|jgi:phosphoribosyl-ATP pyrophosphohydrolase/phosphoribosyl-AMP cyclohydrolase